MDSKAIDFSKYRLERAKETLKTANPFIFKTNEFNTIY